MKRISKGLIVIITVIIFITGSFVFFPTYAEETTLTNEQRNAIAMLNYITVLTQDINASKNSRLYMEEAYSSLINNTYPNAVDSRTLSQLSGLLDTMENYRMINVKRERLQYIYEQNQAQAIRSAIPNPLGLLSAVESFSLRKLVASIIYMAVDSVTSYNAYKNQAELQYLQDGWALDDEESSILHESRKGTFSYMVRMVNEYSLPGDMSLTEGSVENFVNWKNNGNVVSRIQFLESNEKTYQAYGGYWLLLAESYYENGDYEKCIEAINSYEKIDVRIFRRDYELANVLPLGISAAKEILDNEDYAAYATEHVKKIITNTDPDDWSLRYFTAQTLIDVATVTEDRGYLDDAYDIVLDIVNTMMTEQHTLNTTYLSKVEEIPVPKGATKSEKADIQKYNKMLKEIRKTEVPPVYEPLKLCCDLLFALAEEISITPAEQARVDRMLHPNGEKLFLSEAVDENYWFDHTNSTEQLTEVQIDFVGNIIIVPAAYLTGDTVISVTVTGGAVMDTAVLSDWHIEQVKRGDNSDFSTYEAAYVSSDSKHFTWVPDSNVIVKLYPNGIDNSMYEFNYHTVSTKNNWYDYLKVWEGHKNNWYDYAKVWENSVTFEPVN